MIYVVKGDDLRSGKGLINKTNGDNSTRRISVEFISVRSGSLWGSDIVEGPIGVPDVGFSVDCGHVESE